MPHISSRASFIFGLNLIIQRVYFSVQWHKGQWQAQRLKVHNLKNVWAMNYKAPWSHLWTEQPLGPYSLSRYILEENWWLVRVDCEWVIKINERNEFNLLVDGLRCYGVDSAMSMRLPTIICSKNEDDGQVFKMKNEWGMFMCLQILLNISACTKNYQVQVGLAFRGFRTVSVRIEKIRIKCDDELISLIG